MTMAAVRLATTITIVVLLPLISAFSPPNFAPTSRIVPLNSRALSLPSSSSWPLFAAGKGFGEKPLPPTKQSSNKPPSPDSNVVENTTSSPTIETSSASSSTDNTGSKLLQQLRSREAEKRDLELQKLRELRAVDAALQEDPGAAAIPEKVAARMGKRMLPFVGVPLFGSMGAFVAFWYLATYKNMEFQPAIVATTTFVFLAIGLLGITYSVMSASWDDDREGSGLGLDEFQKNVGSLKEGFSRSKENALLRERMAGLSEEEIQRAINEQERRQANAKK